MKKKMSIVLAIALSLSLAVVAINCGGDDCTAGTLNCECADGACDGDLVCNASNVCEAAAGGCCNGAEGMIDVSGTVTDLYTQGPAAVAVTALSGLHVMTGTATPLGGTTSAADGSFTIDCFDVSGASMGLVLLTGAAGTDFFPTLTGVAGYSDDPADKVCIEATPPVWAMPNAFVTQLDLHPQIDSAANGIVIGFIVSATGAPIEGATVTLGDGNPVDGTVIYPSADFTTFDGTATSATGIYMIPDLGLVTLTAVADGHTFATDLYKAATVAGYIYMVSMQAE